MDLKQLQSFVAAAQYGSFTKAADALYISQPSVSAHVHALEEELGCRLLLRTTRHVELTPQGREVLEYARHVLTLCERMEQCCRQEEERIIRLGASTVPSAYILPSLLRAYGERCPQVYFQIQQHHSGEIADGVAGGLYDLGMIAETDERLVCRPLCRDRMVLITPVSERYLALQKKRTPAQMLLEEPVILREPGGAKSADRYLKQAGISEADMSIAARVNDQETVKNLVAGGLGVSLISQLAAQDFVREKRVLRFDLTPIQERTLYIAWRRGETLRPHVRAFVHFINAHMQSTDG